MAKFSKLSRNYKNDQIMGIFENYDLWVIRKNFKYFIIFYDLG